MLLKASLGEHCVPRNFVHLVPLRDTRVILAFSMLYEQVDLSKNFLNHTIYLEKTDEWSPTLFSKTIY